MHLVVGMLQREIDCWQYLTTITVRHYAVHSFLTSPSTHVTPDNNSPNAMYQQRAPNLPFMSQVLAMNTTPHAKKVSIQNNPKLMQARGVIRQHQCRCLVLLFRRQCRIKISQIKLLMQMHCLSRLHISGDKIPRFLLKLKGALLYPSAVSYVLCVDSTLPPLVLY